MKAHIRLTKFSYLKTPLHSWDYTNEVGGGGNNSGMHRSRKACVTHLKANLRIPGLLDLPVIVVEVHGNDENDKPVETIYETIVSKL
jgi:hypothetical protein